MDSHHDDRRYIGAGHHTGDAYQLGVGRRRPVRPVSPHGNHVLDDFESDADRQAEQRIAGDLRVGLEETLRVHGSVTIEDAYAFIGNDDWAAYDVPKIANRILREFTAEHRLRTINITRATRPGRHASTIRVWGP